VHKYAANSKCAANNTKDINSLNDYKTLGLALGERLKISWDNVLV